MTQPSLELFRDRIVEFRRIPGAEFLDNQGNWRTHPDAQREGLTGVLRSVGIVDVLIAYYSQRNEGQLTLLDGHLRKSTNPKVLWPTIIVDLTDEEADLVLATLDPLSAMAGMDADKLKALTRQVNSDDVAVREILRKLEDQAYQQIEASIAPATDDQPGPPAMEVLPFEHWDYVFLTFRSELDWIAAIETLGLDRRSDIRKTPKVGLCRVIDGARVVELIRTLRGQVQFLESQQSRPVREIAREIVSQ